MMWPLTCGAMPTKLARTVASSVCGRVSHCSSVTTTAQSIHDGKNEPMTLICGPTVFPLSVRCVGVRDLACCEREGRRRLQQLNLRVELHESRATQLAPGGEKVGQRAQPHTIRLQRVLV